MREIPVDVLLHLPLPNYKHPKTRGPALLYINGILIGITLAVVLLRVYTRVFIKRWMGADDWLILIATVFAVGLTACVVLANEKYYWDRHIWDVPMDKIPKLGQIALAAKLFFSFATFFTRVSLLSFYYRLLHDTSMKTYKIVLHAAGIFNVVVFFAFVFLTIFQCSPVAAYWIFPATGKCMNEGKLTLACGVINCFLDLLVTTLPIPMVLMLKMPMRQRIGVIVLLSLGFVVTIAGVVRTFYIYKSLMVSYDETWFAYPLWIAAAVEVDLAVICACAPTIRPLLLMYLGPLITSLSGSRSNPSHPKCDGYIYTGSGPSGQNRSNDAGGTFDEKISHVALVRDDGETPQEAQVKLTIMQRVSWEVDYEDQSKLEQGGDLGLLENDHYHGIATSSPSDEERHLRSGRRRRSRSVDIIEAMRRYDFPPSPRLQTVEPNAPFAWIKLDSSQSGDGPATSETESFWRSESNVNLDSTRSNHVPDLHDVERGRDIRHNPFRHEQQVAPTLPPQRTYAGARIIEMKAFARSKSPLMQVQQQQHQNSR